MSDLFHNVIDLPVEIDDGVGGRLLRMARGELRGGEVPQERRGDPAVLDVSEPRRVREVGRADDVDEAAAASLEAAAGQRVGGAAAGARVRRRQLRAHDQKAAVHMGRGRLEGLQRVAWDGAPVGAGREAPDILRGARGQLSVRHVMGFLNDVNEKAQHGWQPAAGSLNWLSRPSVAGAAAGGSTVPPFGRYRPINTPSFLCGEPCVLHSNSYAYLHRRLSIRHRNYSVV